MGASEVGDTKETHYQRALEAYQQIDVQMRAKAKESLNFVAFAAVRHPKVAGKALTASDANTLITLMTAAGRLAATASALVGSEEKKNVFNRAFVKAAGITYRQAFGIYDILNRGSFDTKKLASYLDGTMLFPRPEFPIPQRMRDLKS